MLLQEHIDKKPGLFSRLLADGLLWHGSYKKNKEGAKQLAIMRGRDYTESQKKLTQFLLGDNRSPSAKITVLIDIIEGLQGDLQKAKQYKSRSLSAQQKIQLHKMEESLMRDTILASKMLKKHSNTLAFTKMLITEYDAYRVINETHLNVVKDN